MSLFGNKRKCDLQYQPTVFLGEADITAEALDYDSVLQWLVGLSDDDYVNVYAVASIYRKADKDANGVLGVENEPTTFIKDPEPDLDPNDELYKAFEGSEPDPLERKHKKPKAKRKA